MTNSQFMEMRAMPGVHDAMPMTELGKTERVVMWGTRMGVFGLEVVRTTTREPV